ncbi:MAG: RDD family protein, partial [Planctomycetota bacterium]
MNPSIRYAGAGRRFLAHIIDSGIIFAGMFVFGFFLHLLGLADITTNSFFNVIVYALTFVYYAIFIAGTSATTPGGKVAGIRIVHMSGARL